MMMMKQNMRKGAEKKKTCYGLVRKPKVRIILRRPKQKWGENTKILNPSGSGQ
jgi:hypothetical protein